MRTRSRRRRARTRTTAASGISVRVTVKLCPATSSTPRATSTHSPAREAVGSKRAPKGARADALAVAPYAGTEQLSWVKTLDESLTMDDRGRAALPPAAFEAAAFAVVDGADPREPTSSKGEAKVAKWTPLAVDGPVPLGRVPAAAWVPVCAEWCRKRLVGAPDAKVRVAPVRGVEAELVLQPI